MPLNSADYWAKFRVGYDSPFYQKPDDFSLSPPPSPIKMLVFLNTNNIQALNGNLLESVGIT